MKRRASSTTPPHEVAGRRDARRRGGILASRTMRRCWSGGERNILVSVCLPLWLPVSLLVSARVHLYVCLCLCHGLFLAELRHDMGGGCLAPRVRSRAGVDRVARAEVSRTTNALARLARGFLLMSSGSLSGWGYSIASGSLT